MVTQASTNNGAAAPPQRHKRLVSKIEQLSLSRGRVFEKLREIPDRMQRLTNQVELLLQLADDYASGRYRKVRWYSLAIAVTAALYFVSPSDVIPDWVPVLGHLDDLLLIGVALKLVQADLRAYAEYRGLDPDRYF
jgi:uncharacterized membrane protein YkvA (DUF1232 family)